MLMCKPRLISILCMTSHKRGQSWQYFVQYWKCCTPCMHAGSEADAAVRMDGMAAHRAVSSVRVANRYLCVQAQMEALQEVQQLQAPTLRRSTRERIEEAEKERQRAEQVRPQWLPVPEPSFDCSRCMRDISWPAK